MDPSLLDPPGRSVPGARWLSALFVLLTIILLNSCSKNIPEVPKRITVNSKDELIVYLDSLEQKYEQAVLAVGIANWNSYSKEAPYNLDSAKKELGEIFLDTTSRNIIDEWRGRSSSLADKLLARRLELWHRVFLGGAIYADPEIAALENRLQETMTDFQFRFNGAPVTRAKILQQLRDEPKQAVRHKLWSVPSQLTAAVSGDLVKLVTLRNAKARACGFPNYYSLVLYLNAIDEEWLLKTSSLLEEETRDAFQQFLLSSSRKLHVKQIGPWDVDYALRETASLPDRYFPGDSLFGILHRFEEGIGFTVDSLPIREYVKDIPYGGLNLAIDIPKDSRFLINPLKGYRIYSIAFHEYGHALKAVHTRVDFPILKGYEWIPGAQCAAYEEGVADMNAAFTEDSLWLESFAHVKPRIIQKYLASRSIVDIYRVRNTIREFSLEDELYKDPRQALPVLERNLTKKYLLMGLDSTEAPQYASSIWLVAYPCYFHNYLMASMIAAQLQEALSDKFGEGKSQNPAVAKWIISHLYLNGELQEWTDRIREATGKGLEPGALLRQLGIVPAPFVTQG